MSATLPSTGDANWQDLVDNWTEADAEFLQSRMVQRVTNASDFTLGGLVGTTPGAGNALSSIETGRVFYNTTTKNLVVSTTGLNAGLKALFSSSVIKVVDTGSASEIILTGGSTGSGITFAADGSISVGANVTFTGTVTAPAISATNLTGSGFLSVRAGNAAGKLVTDTTGVKLNTTASADSTAAVRLGTTTGNVLSITNSTGGSASITLGGAVTAGSASISGAVASGSLSSGSVSVSTIIASGAVSVNSLTSTTSVGAASLSSSGTLSVTGTSTLGTVNAGALSGSSLTISGAAAFTAVPTTTGGNPTVANALSRKQYVDDSVFQLPKLLYAPSGLTADPAPNPTSTKYYIIAGTAVKPVITDLGGKNLVQIPFAPTGFPNGCLTVVAIPGDEPNVGTGPYWSNFVDDAGFAFYCPGTIAGQLFRVNYIAMGW